MTGSAGLRLLPLPGLRLLPLPGLRLLPLPGCHLLPFPGSSSPYNLKKNEKKIVYFLNTAYMTHDIIKGLAVLRITGE